MKIGIIEWNIGCGGGRHSTMLAFAECLNEAGYDISVFSQLNKPASEILHFYGCKSLDSSCLIDTPLQRRYDNFEIPPQWKKQDLLIVSYGGWGHIQKYININVVAWIIHPDQGRDSSCTRYWTNSHKTATRLLNDKRWEDAPIEVVIPPHNYSMFRRSAKPWHERRYDVALVGAAIPSKRLLDAARLTRRLGFSTVAAVKTYEQQMSKAIYNQTDLEQADIVQGLRTLGADTVVNASRNVVAELLGESKYYLSLSTDESCSLVIYEALNAGCIPVIKDVGAAKEQLNGRGAVIQSETDAEVALTKYHNNAGVIHRGLQFDRKTVLPMVLAAVERAMQ